MTENNVPQQIVILSPAQRSFVEHAIKGFSSQWRLTIAAGAGSERIFIRMERPQSQESYILIVWNSQDRDWIRFVGIEEEMARGSASAGQIFLPEVFEIDDKRGLILEQDFGSVTLNRFTKENRDPVRIWASYTAVLQTLLRWQASGAELSRTLRARSMDVAMFQWESEYFGRHCVTEYFGLNKLLDERWETERSDLAANVSSLPTVAIHRDFQSENVMMTPQGVRFVDFQGARLGPAAYDVASLLLDPYVDVIDKPTERKLLDFYNVHAPVPISAEEYRLNAIQRLMQALGAYSNLSLHKGKVWYHAFIPVALRRLEIVLSMGDDYRQIHTIVTACLDRTESPG